MLHNLPGGASAKPFVTHHNALSMDLYLRIAPELYLKRLIIGGISEKIFEMNRCFRNEGISLRHNPEFTMVEIYQTYSDYYDMMDLFEDLIYSLSNKLSNNNDTCEPNKELDISVPWFSVTLLDLIYKFLGLDFISKRTVLEATEIAQSINIEVPEGYSWGKIVFLIFERKIEDHLIQPIHILDMPYDISPLARVKSSDPRLTERFESFINGWEIANSFSEIADPIDQRRRFQEQQDLKNILTDDVNPYIDEDFLIAMEHGMPPTGGLGIGIDRLVMLLTNSINIKDVIAFPTMRTRS
jgi:lysyl-tRNA synthetase class 2